MTFEAASLKRNIALRISEYITAIHSLKNIYYAKYCVNDTYNGDQGPALWEKSWHFLEGKADRQ